LLTDCQFHFITAATVEQRQQFCSAPSCWWYGGAEKLRNVLALSDASIKLLRFVSDDVWGSKGVCRVISRSISAYLVQAWDVRNSCKHTGAVLPLSAAPVGRGADGVDAMASFGNLMMMMSGNSGATTLAAYTSCSMFAARVIWLAGD
jgi:hypothetical protein